MTSWNNQSVVSEAKKQNNVVVNVNMSGIVVVTAKSKVGKVTKNYAHSSLKVFLKIK